MVELRCPYVLYYTQRSPEGIIMAYLPTELLAKVCAYCNDSTRTLKALRLVNREFAELAGSVLFENVYFMLSQQSLGHLHQIASSPSLRRHVRKISFFSLLLSKYYTKCDAWVMGVDNQEQFEPMFQFSHPLLRNVQQTLDTPQEGYNLAYDLHMPYHDRYMAMLKDQDAALKNIDSVVSPAIAALPNVRALELLVDNPKLVASIRPDTFADGTVYSLPQAQIDKCNPFPAKIRTELLLHFPFENITCEKDQYRCAALPIASILRALGRSGKSIQEMVLDGLPSCFWESNVSRVNSWDTVMQDAAGAFLHLQELDLRIRFSDSQDIPKSLTRINGFLEQAHKLRVISLDLVIPDPEVDISPLLRNIVCSDLSRIALASCLVTEHAFIAFLLRHAKTLTTLELRHMDINGTWRRVFGETATHLNSLGAVNLQYLWLTEMEDASNASVEKSTSTFYLENSLYYDRLSEYLLSKGQLNYPIIRDKSKHSFAGEDVGHIS